MRSYSIGKVVKLVKISAGTLRKWDKEGVFKPFLVAGGGRRYYSKNQLEYLLRLKSDGILNKKTLSNIIEE